MSMCKINNEGFTWVYILQIYERYYYLKYFYYVVFNRSLSIYQGQCFIKQIPLVATLFPMLPMLVLFPNKKTQGDKVCLSNQFQLKSWFLGWLFQCVAKFLLIFCIEWMFLCSLNNKHSIKKEKRKTF